MLHYSVMLNLFPIQFLALFAYFILRICVGVFLILFAKKMKKGILTQFPERTWRANFHYGLYLSIGGLFIIGMLTQFAALFTMCVSAYMFFFSPKSLKDHLPDRHTWLLLFGANCSLFITGAGVLAVDLPI